MDLNKIDFDWVEKTEKPKLLKRALRLLAEDGDYFPDLKRTITEKLMKIDPKFA